MCGHGISNAYTRCTAAIVMKNVIHNVIHNGIHNVTHNVTHNVIHNVIEMFALWRKNALGWAFEVVDNVFCCSVKYYSCRG